MSKPGVTYICSENTASNQDACMVCHYNDGGLMHHLKEGISGASTETFNYHGYVNDYENPMLINDNGKAIPKIEGIFCEALLRPGDSVNSAPFEIFVKFMINPEAAELDDDAFGFPVGWAVRGYTQAKLDSINRERPNDPLRNEMNMLPVFRADFADLAVAGPKSNGKKLRRMYYITNQASYQLLKPKSLQTQVRLAASTDNQDDIAKAKQTVQTEDWPPPRPLPPPKPTPAPATQ